MERHSGTESAQYLAAHNGNIRVSMDTLADTYVGQVSASYYDWNIGRTLDPAAADLLGKPTSAFPAMAITEYIWPIKWLLHTLSRPLLFKRTL